MADDKKYPGGISEQEYVWRNTVAFFTQTQAQLATIDFDQFKLQCEIQIQNAYKGDDVAQMRKQAEAIKAFKKKGGVYRKAFNALKIISEDFTEQFGETPKKSELKIHTNGQKEDRKDRNEEDGTDPNT